MSTDFIYQAKNVLSLDDCQNIIEIINNNLDDATVEHVVNADGSLNRYFRSLNSDKFGAFNNKIENILNHHFKIYFNTYIDYKMSNPPKLIVDNKNLTLEKIKYQKFSPPGHFDWHHEQGSSINSLGRFLVWMIYLNTIDNTGSTDFYYQEKSFQPLAGSLLMWPAGITHKHRGNPNLDTDKYMCTGWFNFSLLHKT